MSGPASWSGVGGSGRILPSTLPGARLSGRPRRDVSAGSYTGKRARASRSPGSVRALERRPDRRPIRRRGTPGLLRAQDRRALSRSAGGTAGGGRRPAGEVPDLRRRGPPDARSPLAGRAHRPAARFDRRPAPWRRGPIPLRPGAGRAGQGVRHRAEGRVVGPRLGRRGAAGKTGSRAVLRRVPGPRPEWFRLRSHPRHAS